MRKDLGKLIKAGYSRADDYGLCLNTKTKATIHPDHYDDEDHGPNKAKFNLHHRTFVDSRKLYKIIKAYIGRPWNEVYSEIVKSCTNLQRPDLEKAINWAIEREAKYIDGIPFGLAANYGYDREINGLYVDSKGIIQKHKPNEKQRKIKPITEIKISENASYKLIDDIWYIIDLEQIEYKRFKYVYEFEKWQLLEPDFSKLKERMLKNGLWEEKKLGEGYWYIWAPWWSHSHKEHKFQCNKKELKYIRKYLAEQSK